MHLRQSLVIVFILAVALVAGQVRAADLPDFTRLASSCGPAVVNINTEKTTSTNAGEDIFGEMFRNMPPGFERFFGPFNGKGGKARPRKQKSLGSGFIISADGYIVTNNHVVAGADVIRVTIDETIQKGEPVKAELIGADEETDLALLKIDVKKKLPYLKFGDSDNLKVGEWLLAIGNPFGLDHTVTAGILSAKGRRINAGAFDNFLQTDASINPGNSGGPLINSEGEVIGINTAIIASGQGIGFAIPSNMANDIINQIKGGKKVSRGWLGIGIQDLDEDTARALGAPDTRGSLVGNVQEGQPAEKAGIQDGDIIIAIDDSPVEDSAELLRIVASKKPGTKVTVVALRNGERKEFKVELGDRQSNIGSDRSSGDKDKRPEATLGISVRQLTPEEAARIKVKGGVVVTAIDEDKPAADADIRRGDVIVKANFKHVKSVEDLTRIVKEEGVKRGAVILQINRNGDLLSRTVPLAKK